MKTYHTEEAARIDAAHSVGTDAPSKRLPTLETEWVTDAELIRRSGVPYKIMQRNLKEYDAKPQLGFPRKFKPYGDRRHWPSVKAYFEKLNTVIPQDSRRRA